MNIEELVGKWIVDIRMEVKDFEYDGSILLEESNSSIILSTGEIFEIPFRNATTVELKTSIPNKQKSIFQTNKPTSFFSNLTSFFSDDLTKRNTKKVQGKKIISIYHYDENERLDNCIIEVESGFLISEISMAPKGTGHASIWIFTSKNDLRKRMGKGFTQIH